MLCINISKCNSQNFFLLQVMWYLVWIVGDKFVHESKNVIRRFFKTEKSARKTEPDNSYLGSHYDIVAFSTDDLLNRSVLGRLRNAFVAGISRFELLPKFIIVAIEYEFLNCIRFDRAGLSVVLGRCVQWLADEINNTINLRKSQLPTRSKKLGYPQVFWVLMPNHANFLNNAIRFKFNQALDTVLPLYNGMRSLKLCQRWMYHDNSVYRSGNISQEGISTYWSAVDEALQFWEVGKQKCTKPGQGSGREFIQRMYKTHRNQGSGDR